MMASFPKLIAFCGHSYRRVEAWQTEPVYIGTVYAGESLPRANGPVDMGPTVPVIMLAARDLTTLKASLHQAEERFLQDLEKSPTDWSIRLFTDIKPQEFYEFQGCVRQEWTNADQIIRDITLGKTVTLSNAIEDILRV